MPGFKGAILKGQRAIAAYSQDMSGLRVEPRCVALIEDATDVAALFDYASKNGTPITPRGAGSNQSGSAVGAGIIATSLRMNRILSSTDGTIRAEAGAIHAMVDEELLKRGRTLAFDPSSRTFCTIGGNVSTKASGLRGLKYGSVDRWLKSLRFFGPAFGLVDTRELPKETMVAIENLRNEALANPSVVSFVDRRRGLKSSSGYNLQAFFDHETPGDVAAHLLCGSVGTLGVILDVELRTIPIPRERGLLLAFVDSLEKSIKLGLRLRRSGPSGLELVDSHALSELRNGGIGVPTDTEAALMIEFDDNVEEKISQTIAEIEDFGAAARRLAGRREQSNAWRVREAMLLRIKKTMETGMTIVPPFVEDLAVPPDSLYDFTMRALRIFHDEGREVAVYGHVGEGNLHFRLPIPVTERDALVERLGDECARLVLSYGGTITAEHGSGPLRLRYAEQEFGREVLEFFDRIKRTFDPRELLNPGAMPSARAAQQ